MEKSMGDQRQQPRDLNKLQTHRHIAQQCNGVFSR